MAQTLTVATRGGKLAIAQTKTIIAELRKKHPDVQIKIKKIIPSGDRDRNTALWKLKSTGFFTSRLEDALLTGQADLAVHSFKDLPTAARDGLTIAAVCDRKFAEDCLIAAEPVSSIEQLRPSAKIGTSSLRRAAQIKHLRADLKTEPIRGNVMTRIRKLEKGKFDAIVLARAGLERLGLGNRASVCFAPGNFIPAPAQGALAVQTRTEDTAVNRLIADIDDKETRLVTSAERKVLAVMHAGCHAPVGAFARIEGGSIELCVFISDLQGKNYIKRQITGPVEKAQSIAENLARQLLEAGGKEILEVL